MNGENPEFGQMSDREILVHLTTKIEEHNKLVDMEISTLKENTCACQLAHNDRMKSVEADIKKMRDERNIIRGVLIVLGSITGVVAVVLLDLYATLKTRLGVI